MREIVRDELGVDMYRARNQEVVLDRELRNEVVDAVFSAFEAFCRDASFPAFRERERPDGTFDSDAYVDYQIRRHAMLNAFSISQPRIVACRERVFAFEFSSEVEVAVWELSASEIRDMIADPLRARGPVEALRQWWAKFGARRRAAVFIASAKGRRRPK